MPKAKRKTLPKNFSELIEAGDIDALKEAFDTCEFNAYNHSFEKNTALHHYNVPDELVRWLVENGADINSRNHYEKTPLHEQTEHWRGNAALFIELGADVNATDIYGETPLHCAVCYGRVQNARELIANGADIHAEAQHGATPLAYALNNCDNVKIAEISEISKILIDAGAKLTPPMAESVKRIGEQFEFYRADFNKELLPEVDVGLTNLYELFGVEPVAKRSMQEDNAPIIVPDGKWGEQHDALWSILVPGKGHAKTVQGEVIRISGKLAREIMDNGGINWDDEFRKMLTALMEFFATGNPLVRGEFKEAKKLARHLRNGRGDDEPERLMALAVHWVAQNPQPEALGKTTYTR